MTTMYSIVAGMDGDTEFAVCADDTKAVYIWPDGVEPLFGDDRIIQLAEMRDTPPTTAEEWIATATYNIGYSTAQTPVEFGNNDFEACRAQAKADLDLEVKQQSMGPVNPDEAHEFVPLTIGDEICGLCDQAPDAEVHQE